MTNNPNDEERLAEQKQRTRMAINALQQHPDTIYADGHWCGLEIWTGLETNKDSDTLENIEWLFGLTLTHASVKHDDEHGTVLDLEYDLIEDHEIPVEDDRITELLDFYDPNQSVEKPIGAAIDDEHEFRKGLVSREDLKKGDVHNHDDVLAALHYDNHNILHDDASGLLSDDNPFGIGHYLDILELAVEPNRFAILHALFNTNDGKSASELADVLGKDGYGLHQHLDRLVDAGLVANWTKHDPETGNYSYFEITGTGHSLHEAITHLIDVEQEASEQFRSGE
ncbi:winged helix-turn-helix domain-containing protein [Natribaculum luteum]|uniref:Winged helix-turn-helix domain-containing protein n=1 Tax=Natribaculum luteum TaxID=1586232 RepID=A0ABD5P5P4_9EURY|nr:helix-turn-helix domain-containing protein [Natribaculum luteum]